MPVLTPSLADIHVLGPGVVQFKTSSRRLFFDEKGIKVFISKNC